MARFLIACGGTGGHFYPGLVLGQALKAKGHQPLFLLRKGDPAFATLESLRLPSAEADVLGLPRGLLADWPSWTWRSAWGFRTVARIIRTWRPDAVVGMGAYLTLPAALFARLRGIPVLLHESNARLGLANRLARPMASRVAFGLPGPDLGSRALLTGTPVRAALLNLPPPGEARRALGLDPDRRTLLVFGGSQGAEALNRLALGALRSLAARRPGSVQALLIAGRRLAEAARGLARGLPVVVLDYLEEMEKAFAAADLVVCRSGAGTVAELIATRRPAILVPYPHAAGRHQSHNVRVLEEAGAALALEEDLLSEKVLESSIERVILSEAESLHTMQAAFRALPDPGRAAERLFDCAEGLLSQERTIHA